jgi:protein-S-isoprenylcysteine O-methyltransferase Ste14
MQTNFLQLATIIVFVIATLGLAWLSRRSLLDPGTHGFYRFFAWDLDLALLLFNLPRWFVDPLSWHQVISWLLLLISLYLLITSLVQLRRGKPDRSRKDEALLGLERTTSLVTTGLYRYIRHPMYSSLLFLAWGVFFKHPDLLNGLFALLASVFLFATARVEEREDIRFFGPAYAEYIQRSGMFLPRIIRPK